MPNPIGGIGQGIGQIGTNPGFPGIGRGGASEGGTNFGDTLKEALSQVSASQDHASDTVAAFLRGEPVELHQVMAATEEAGIALEMLIEVRNKFTDAYRTIINMQG
ncbi:MAG TPA: flagellar hook-basal body complex protein FliE [Longimicrobiaceae bacterium]|nr:flagellar hook-basal body complex protein FliE [Longimicrobiaceae bacterium]